MIAVPVRYRKAQRGLFVQKIQHAVPSFVVFSDGLEHLSHEHPGLSDLALGGFEVVASVLVIGSVIRGFRAMMKETAAVMFAVGILHPRLAAWGDRRRELRVGPDGISVSYRKFARLTLSWAEVASIETDDRSAVITATDGRSARINLGDAFHPKAIRDALMTANTFLDDARHAASASIESATTDA